MKNNKNIKRLFFDIETSPNIVFSWRTGFNINIDAENIIEERSIICICYKWENDDNVYSLKWNNKNDKYLIKNFLKVINKADEIIGHNSDKFDIKWFRTRCLYHGIESLPEFKTIDTLKIAKSKFYFNSNKLDYISKFLGYTGKIKTDFQLWKNIVLFNDSNALNKMINYCKKDVLLLESIFKKMQGYTNPKTNIAVLLGKEKCDCPYCASDNIHSQGKVVSAAGIIKYKMQCQNCGKYFRISNKDFEKFKTKN